MNSTSKVFDAYEIKKQFPCLNQKIEGKEFVFLDSAASTQKPKSVLDSLYNTYAKEYANIHRGIYYLSDLATRKFEETREKVAEFINAKSSSEIVFTKGATESINLVAHSYAMDVLKAGDEILISEMEHHSNMIPWQIVAEKTGAKLKIIPILDTGELDFEAFKKMLSKGKTKIVSIIHMANVLSVIVDIKKVIDLAHEVGAVVLVDACQSAAHLQIDVKQLDVDFFVCSAHKMYGPNAVGILYAKYDLLEKMKPYQLGGSMVEDVDYLSATYKKSPFRFEAGTPAISEVIAFKEAINFLNSIDKKALSAYRTKLLQQLTDAVNSEPGFKILGEVQDGATSLSFLHETAHPNDIGMILNKSGVAIRTGHHCCMPLMKKFGISGTARASLAVYNTEDDILLFKEALKKVNRFF